MQNAILGWPNWTYEASVSGGSWETSYPAANAADDEMARIARSTDLNSASLEMTFTLAEPRTVQVVGAGLPNASTSAEMRVRLFDDTSTEIHDSGWVVVFPEVMSQDQLLWESTQFWSRTYAATELKGTVFVRPYQTGTTAKAKSVQINFADANNPDGFLDVAYILTAQSWQLGINFEPGASFGYKGARTRKTRAAGGAMTFDRLPKARVFEGQVGLLDRDEAMQQTFEMFRQADIDTLLLWWPFPDLPQHWPRETFFARNKEISPLGYAIANLNYMEVPLRLEEWL